MITITLEHPVQENLSLLHRRHALAMSFDTPPESNHMLNPEALTAPGVLFYVLREEGAPLGMAALKRLDDTAAEIKSMHVLLEARGRGLARMLLGHLVTEARERGFSRLLLETGTQDSFAPARALYLARGFEIRGPFGDYLPDPNSAYMMLTL